MADKRKTMIALGAAAGLLLALGLYFAFTGGEQPQRPSGQGMEETAEMVQSLPEPATPDEQAALPEPSTDSEITAQPEATAPKRPVEDETIRLSFVEDLAKYCVGEFLPARTKRNPSNEPRLLLTFKKLNMRYGLNPERLEMQDLTAADARQRILARLMNPDFVSTLFSLYADEFVSLLVEYGTRETRLFAVAPGRYEEEAFSGEEVGTMLRMYALKSREVGRVFAVIASEPAVLSQVENYLLAVKNVHDAYALFWNREHADGRQVEEAGKKIKEAIVQREKMRNAVVDTVLDKTERVSLSKDEVLYIAQWAFRRTRTNQAYLDSLGELGASLNKLSGKLMDRAEIID